jgi:mRNA interferase RelE/StbE
VTRLVVVAGRARRQLSALPMPVSVAILEFCNGPLAEEPWRLGKPLLPPLAPLWSARRGAYRILYRWTDTEVHVEAVAHRADVYRP